MFVGDLERVGDRHRRISRRWKMGRKQIAAMGMVGVLLGAGSLLASTGSASASPAGRTGERRCAATDATPWPEWANGRPAGIDPKTAAGTFMWHDKAGWNIRVTHVHDARRTFAGRLTTAGRFFAVRAVRLEGHDAVKVSADHHTLTFRFGNYGAVDGLNFRVACAPSIGFGFASDGTMMPASKVTIGHSAVNPATNPFEISRS
jgi:hypothetical protein